MAKYKVVRTERREIESVEEINEKPRFKVGQWVEVYSGPYEGHSFVVKDIRFNADKRAFEFHRECPMMGGWFSDGMLAE